LEVRKIRHSKANCSGIVDGCHDTSGISQLFANKYKDLYSSVAYDNCDLDNLSVDIDAMLGCEVTSVADWFISVDDVLHAISSMKPNKYDGINELSSDYVLHAGRDLAVHISFVFSAMIIHGSVPDIFLTSTILPIPKNKNGNVTDSANYRGIALSSVFVKIFDHVILEKYRDRLCTSELQFGFKRKSSTHACTLLLKEVFVILR